MSALKADVTQIPSQKPSNVSREKGPKETTAIEKPDQKSDFEMDDDEITEKIITTGPSIEKSAARFVDIIDIAAQLRGSRKK